MTRAKSEPAADHPAWCCGGHDDPADLTDSVHLGPDHRFTAEADDVEVTLALYRWDVRARPGKPGHTGQTGVLLTVANHLDRPDGGPLAADVFLTVNDLRALARRADRLADQAERTR